MYFNILILAKLVLQALKPAISSRIRKPAVSCKPFGKPDELSYFYHIQHHCAFSDVYVGYHTFIVGLVIKIDKGQARQKLKFGPRKCCSTDGSDQSALVTNFVSLKNSENVGQNDEFCQSVMRGHHENVHICMQYFETVNVS